MLCPNCNSNIPIGQQFCSECGKRVEVQFDQIQDAVLSDAADRRAGQLEKVLLNVVGGLIVLWVGLKLLNDHYLQTKFPAGHSGSLCLTAPAPKVSSRAELAVKVTAPTAPAPRVVNPGPRGMSWRRDPFKEDLRKAAGGAGTARALERGLKYLAKNQQSDGGWLVSGDAGGSRQSDWARTGVTALACLAFMGDGHTWIPLGEGTNGKPAYSFYAKNVRNGVRSLTSQQADSGLVGPKRGHYMYNHGFATAALCEAYAMTGDPYLGKAAKNAVGFIIKAQQKNGGWDYFERQAARSDTSVSTAQLMGLYAAHLAGLKVPAEVFERGLGWVDSVTDPKTLNVGYDQKWTPRQRFIGYGSTAMGLVLKLYLWRSPSSQAVRRQARTLLGLAPPDYDPKWDEKTKARKLDYYYLYHATMAFHRLGGKDWETWNKKVVKVLTGSQEAKGAHAGAWPLYDKYAKEAGRTYATAVALLTLEVYYRYP